MEIFSIIVRYSIYGKTKPKSTDFSSHIRLRELFTWTSIFDKEGNRLIEPIDKLLKNLTDSHLNNIVDYYFDRDLIPPKEIVMEILFRSKNPEFRIRN